MVYRFVRFVTLGALVAAAACSAPVPSEEPVSANITNAFGGPSAGPRNSAKLGEFTVAVDHKSRTLSFKPVGGTPLILDDNLQPLSQNSITDDQGGGGVCGAGGQACNTIDLVSTSCNDTYDATTGGVQPGATFQCDVEMRSYYKNRALPNVYAQISAETLSGVATDAYDAISGSDDTDTTYTPPLSNTHGLWAYQNGSSNGAFLSANDGSNGGNGSGLNAASRTWQFLNPQDQNVVYTISIWASLAYSRYQQTFGNSSYVAVCPHAGGTGTVESATSKTKIALPFDLTVYQNNYNTGSSNQEINVAQNGQITFGAPTGTSALDASGTAVALPSTATNVPRPAFFAFWDNLKKSTTDANADICTQLIGTAPNRQFVIEWYDYDFTTAPPGTAKDGPNKGSSLDFEVFIDEGSGEIDTVYNNMVLATGAGTTANRESGSLATVGIQDATGTVATADYKNASGNTYGTGDAWSYIPLP